MGEPWPMYLLVLVKEAWCLWLSVFVTEAWSYSKLTSNHIIMNCIKINFIFISVSCFKCIYHKLKCVVTFRKEI